MTSFATELATPSVTDVRYVRTDNIPRLIYKKYYTFTQSKEQRGGPLCFFLCANV